VAGVDEVGRGCLSGPVTVGVVLVEAGQRPPPRGLRDSKLLTAPARRALVPRIQRWVAAWAVADASAAEIDELGLIAALRLAGHRALAALPTRPDCVLLDGNHDYLTPPGAGQPELPFDSLPPFPPVRTQVKADVRCASVAAASVLAKATRDAHMARLAADHPEYGWDVNKGYATPHHRQALRRVGPSPYHRLSWRLGLDDAYGEELGLDVLDGLDVEGLGRLDVVDLAAWESGEGQDDAVILVDGSSERSVDGFLSSPEVHA
jgi:ribonuclease HII